MRHGKKFKHLSRPASHRKALLANQAKSLILHKRITTTVAKAKALRKFIEPIITKSKQDSTHARRTVFSYFQDKEPVKVLFNEVAHKVGDRPGGYTRIIKMGTRLGDNAEVCMMELVDYNELLQQEAKPKKTRTRRGKGKAKATTPNEPGATSQPNLTHEESDAASSETRQTVEAPDELATEGQEPPAAAAKDSSATEAENKDTTGQDSEAKE